MNLKGSKKVKNPVSDESMSWHQKIAANRGREWAENVVKGRLDAVMNPSRLRLIRTSKNLLQEDVAKKLGLSNSTYQSIERGKVKISYDRALKIANSLGTSADKLFKLVGKDKYVAIIQKSSV